MKKSNEETVLIVKVTSLILQLIRKGENLKKYQSYINAVKHGDYTDLITQNKGNTPPMVIFNQGNIKYSVNEPDYLFEFEGLIKSSYSLIKIWNELKDKLTDFVDDEITELEFQKLAEFEIAIRIHAKNNNLFNSRLDLVDIINLLASHLHMDNEEKEKLQKGRVQLNIVKHHKKKPVIIQEFIDAFKVLEKYRIQII